MSIVLETPTTEDLGSVTDTLRGWQDDNGPLQLHPGDLGWYSLRGSAATAAAIRTWSRDGRTLAIGLLDGADLLRMALDPGARDDDELAQRIAADADDPQHGILKAGSATIEARGADRLTQTLAKRGWHEDEPWTPLRLDLSNPADEADLRVEIVDLDRADAWTSVHWSAFRGTPFAEEDQRKFVDGWLTMAEGPFYAAARSLAAFDPQDNAVAVATVWSAGPNRPGLLEPMGVHRDHRGQGYGAAITRAAASNLREMGSSSAIVCAESSNVGAVSTYTAAGFTAQEQVADMHRSA